MYSAKAADSDFVKGLRAVYGMHIRHSEQVLNLGKFAGQTRILGRTTYTHGSGDRVCIPGQSELNLISTGLDRFQKKVRETRCRLKIPSTRRREETIR